MNKKELWQVFMKTGKVSDYLNYKNARDSESFPPYEDEEIAEEFASDDLENSEPVYPEYYEDLNY